MKIILLLYLVFGVGYASAQSLNSDVIEWNVDSLRDLHTGSYSPYTCKFITYDKTKVEWIQAGDIRTLAVLNLDGNWDDIKLDGSVTMVVRMKTKTGKLIFTRRFGVPFIEMEFKEGEDNVAPYQFRVSQIQQVEP